MKEKVDGLENEREIYILRLEKSQLLSQKLRDQLKSQQQQFRKLSDKYSDMLQTQSKRKQNNFDEIDTERFQAYRTMNMKSVLNHINTTGKPSKKDQLLSVDEIENISDEAPKNSKPNALAESSDVEAAAGQVQDAGAAASVDTSYEDSYWVCLIN